MNTERKNNSEGSKYFATEDEFEKMVKLACKNLFDSRLYKIMIRKSIVVTVIERPKINSDENNVKKYIALDELEVCKKIFELNHNINESEIKFMDFDTDHLVENIKIAGGTYISYDIAEAYKSVPAFVRNIVLNSISVGNEWLSKPAKISALGISIVTTNIKICSYVESALFRKHQLDSLKSSTFLSTSTYMGSKRKIIGFIIESLFPYTNKSSIFFDLMCGSGAVSNGFAQIGITYASDAQEFCKLLAKIQGAGFNESIAQKILGKISKYYNNNLKELQQQFGKQLQEENLIFHIDSKNKKSLVEQYKKFISSVKLYSTTEKNTYEIEKEINARKIDNKKFPYCLFTYYFANIYFGFAQCIQLDSIRYAIDQIENSDIKEWLLGVFVVVASVIGSGHAGHFAQPRNLDEKSVELLIRKRKKSAWLEFSKRLMTIGAESKKYKYRVNMIKGPWEVALDTIASKEFSKDLIIYVDAPYKREEYSRYYHVLETAVKYDYPCAELKGKVRSKKNGERFASEFFTKDKYKMENNIIKIITKILSIGAVCVWSYSDNAKGSINEIISKIIEINECNIYIYSIPYLHNSQRKKEPGKLTRLNVIEYSIIFIPKDHHQMQAESDIEKKTPNFSKNS